MKHIEALTANKWYPLQAGRPLYPTPQSILRSAVGAEEYKFVSESITTDHIRAAVIMPLNVPFQHLLANEPWGMTYTTKEWRMLIVSTIDPNRWIELARASGAKAWLKGHNMTITYNWEPPELDDTGNKKRPTNAVGDRVPEPGLRNDKGIPRKNYIRADLVDDLRDKLMTYVEIGQKHGLSRIRVMDIAKEENLTRKTPSVKT